MAIFVEAVHPAAGYRSSLLSIRAPWNRLASQLFQSVDISSLVFFRILFGGIMLFEIHRYFRWGWIRSYFITTPFHFNYSGFEWVRPWPGELMFLHFWLLAFLATCIVLGIHYRLAATLFFLGYTYVFLIDKALYLNHLYLVGLLAFILIFLPAHKAFSLDSRGHPDQSSDTVSAWAIWLLRIQIGIPYFYGGLAKLNEDWLLAEPMRMWLAGMARRPIFGPLLAQEWTAYAFSYGGLLFDLLIVPLLLWRRTRLVAYVVAVAFHIVNAWLFEIGIFPWFMIGATLIFFPPDFPRRLISNAMSLPLIRMWRHGGTSEKSTTLTEPGPPRFTMSRRIGLGLLGAYVAGQLLIPFRHVLYPGEVSWTEQGHRFSWHMKLRNKTGNTDFYVLDSASSETWKVDAPGDLRRWQWDDMKVEPDMIQQYAHHLASKFQNDGYAVQVRVDSKAALNGRLEQRLIDPSVDLAAQPRTFGSVSWIVPLEQPARKSERS